MSTWFRVVPVIGATALVALSFGDASAQDAAPTERAALEMRGSDSGAVPAASRTPTTVNAMALERGPAYLLSSTTPIVLDPDPCHDVTEHPDPLPAGTAFEVSRSSAFNGVLWYEVKSVEGQQVLGWISAPVLAPLGVTASS